MNRTPRPTRRRAAYTALVLATTAAVAVTGPAATSLPTGVTTTASTTASTSTPVAAPSLFETVDARSAGTVPRSRIVTGDQQLVRLAEDRLPTGTGTTRLSLPGKVGTVRLARTGQDRETTTWEGTLEGQPMSSFTLVRAGGAWAGSLMTPGASYSLSSSPRVDADGNPAGHFWTQLGAPPALGEDGAPAPARPGTAGSGDLAAPDARKKKRKTKVTVMYAYTPKAKRQIGSRKALRAAAGVALSQTNRTFKNSKLKVRVKFKGIVKTKGKVAKNQVTNAFRMYRPRDGNFDNIFKARKRKKADLVQLFTQGNAAGFCGGGLIPVTPRDAHPQAGVSSVSLGCLGWLVPTHEMGHNLGADHIRYRGVTHHSKIRGAYGYINVRRRYLSVMGYYDPCYARGVYNCTRMPFFSSPKGKTNGKRRGTKKMHNNSRAVRLVAPRVSRYTR